ncbi:MAG TPA: 1-propanol dehydrogenase PduQ [Arachnia sp.]|nr:1-propanol dehydrogenase PduQ [Arachnia sp.]
MTTFLLGTEIRFGPTALNELAEFAGSKVLLVTDAFLATTDLFDVVHTLLMPRVTVFRDVEPNPTVAMIGKGVACYLSADPDVVVALGGGSVIDAAKAMHKAALAAGYGASRGLVVIPTTSGSGSEVTSYAVVTDEKTHAKIPMVSPDLQPAIALLDPRAVVGCPPRVTADSGMDVLTHAVEAYVSTGASDFSDACAEKAVHLLCANLHRCYVQGADVEARERMHNGSTLAAMAFNNAGLGIAHSLAHALGGHFPVAHGRLNAMLLPHVMTYNAANCARAARKYAWLGHLTGSSSGSNVKAGVISFVAAVDRLRASLDMPARLSEAGIPARDVRGMLNELAAQAMGDGCTPSNPAAPTHDDLVAILRQVL